MLTGKQRAYLRGQAHAMDPIFQVGKGGISDTVIQQVDEVLEARELVKGKVLQNCMLTAKEAAEELAEETKAEVIQVIGSKFVLFRQNEKESIYTLPK